MDYMLDNITAAFLNLPRVIMVLEKWACPWSQNKNEEYIRVKCQDAYKSQMLQQK